MESLTKFILFAAFITQNCRCFNIDTDFPIVFKGHKNSYFGFSVQLHKTDRDAWALVTAPKGNSSSSLPYYIRQPGVLYKCNLSSFRCTEVILDVPFNDRKITEGFSYKELKSDMMLGISLDVQPGDGSIVTCGHLWKNAEYHQFYSANGVCYVIDKYLNEKTVNKLLPLIEKRKQVISSNKINFYAYGLAGFSAMYTENGKDLILGAPGIYEGKGSLIQFAVRNDSKLSTFPIIPDPNETEERVADDSYVGYSLTSGKFFRSGKISIVSGAPRSENDYGGVYIFESINNNNQELVIQRKKIGHKLTEYFGAAVLAVNVNNDNYTDLLVGAPFYSTPNGGDEGRVYVYLSDGDDLHEQKETLKGSNIPNSRFGTSIANCGDLNKDGFMDIAIGAPYDGRGAVYIYFGSENGVKPDFVQRIAASDFDTELDLSGFGIAISKGKDIDFNAYSDILIGSFDNALLLRSQPVITVHAKLEASIKHISINSTSTKCEINQKEVSCFSLEYCLKYTGNHAPDVASMEIVLEVDKYKIYVPRGYFLQDENKLNKLQKIEFELALLNNTDYCNKQTVYLMKDIQDFITPVKFQLTYNLKNPKIKQFCKSCPVIDVTRSNIVTKEVMFWNGCGDDNECQSDLKLSVKYLSKVEPFVIGENNILEMEVKVENSGEPAYNSSVFVKIPEDIMMINQAECISDDRNTENYTLFCNVGNPLTSDNPKIFQLKMDTSRLSKPVDKLVFEFWVETASKEINPSDNFYTVSIPVIFTTDIQIKGFAENEIIFLREENKEMIPISHTYFVSKRLKNPIPVVDVTLSIPVQLSTDGPQFFELTSLQIGNDTTSNVPSTCDPISEKFVNPIILSRLHRDVSSKAYTHKEHADHSDFDIINLDCLRTVCLSIKCRTGPFVDTEKFAKFQINGYINLTNLQNSVGKKDVTVIISEGKIAIEDASYGKPVKGGYATVATSLEKYGLHQKNKIDIWIIIASVLAGILLFIILILLLLKFGFFRRKAQEEMEKLKKDENDETAALNDNPT